ncbi:contractile injection system tape measure protein [Chromobacterium subtsugae]|uniref:contractile injection system tape measure protein n=1 Tax=Chromobacterium subtsugae TaxID=251747 RepID=UPI000A9FB52D|nr:contractile injection system tape measure protein [Chromobacterium subtsugae]
MKREDAAFRTGHRIETLNWRSLGGAVEREFAHQARLSIFLGGLGREAIERAFDRVSPPGEVWKLDRVEVDLGRLDIDGSFEQWAAVLERQLYERLSRERKALSSDACVAEPKRRAPGAATESSRPEPSSRDELASFFHYLQHGYLPWSVSPMAGRALSAWLVRLAQRTGPRLWRMLQQLHPGDYVLLRLSQITPHQGLQALLEVRHPELASGLLLLDAQVLAPLRARGRLSAYQAAQLQQAWRVAGLRALWGQRGGELGTDRLRRLQRELALALSQQLGQGWGGGWLWMRPRRHASGEDALGYLLLGGLLGVTARRNGMPENATQPRRLILPPRREMAVAAPVGDEAVAATLAKIEDALAGRTAMSEVDFCARLAQLGRHGATLAPLLQAALLRRQTRRVAAERLGAGACWQLMRALNGERPKEYSAGEGAAWRESMRQFALSALAGGARPETGAGGLTELQRWLQEYTLRQLALGQAPPRDAAGWRRFWRQALAEWQAPAVAVDSSWPLPEPGAASPRAEMVEPRRPQPRLRAWWAAARRLGRYWLPDVGGVRRSRALPAYRREMAELARQSRGLPPAVWQARWQQQLASLLRSPVVRPGAVHLQACLQMWRREMARQETSTRMTSSSASSTWLSPCVGGDAGTAVRLQQLERLRVWLNGGLEMDWLRWSPAVAQGWFELLLEHASRQDWRLQVAGEWSLQRRRELLALFATPASARYAHREAADWAWLERAVAYCSTLVPTGALRDVRLSRWLWSSALRWLAGHSSGREPELCRHWLADLGAESRDASLDMVRQTLWARVAGPARQMENRSPQGGWLRRALGLLLPQWSGDRLERLHLRLLSGSGAAEPVGTLARRYAKGLAAALPQWFADGSAAMKRLAAALEQAAPPPVAGGRAARLITAMERALQAGGTDEKTFAQAQPESRTSAQRLACILSFPGLPPSRRSWLGRREIQDWLADPALCRDWLARSGIRQRWGLLRALFPAQGDALRLISARLQRARQALQPEESEARRLARHWEWLAEHLLLEALPPQPECMARRYALRLSREARTDKGARAPSLAHWLSALDKALSDGAGRHGDAERLSGELRRAPSAAEQWQARQPMENEPGSPVPPPTPEGNHYIGNAGLVLLANYSQRLFGMLKLWMDGIFVDEAAHSRAVRCLAYLADGHQEGREPEWVLPKLLCGMPLARPLSDEPELDEATRSLLDSLLAAVISHWQALGATTPEGLRQTFLRRDGKLAQESGDAGPHWRLMVKPGPFDMLLDRLPWSYATIKLPWMQEPLYVDWR